MIFRLSAFFFLIQLLFFVPFVCAQEEECSVDNTAACTVNTDVYCLKEGTVPLTAEIIGTKLQFTLTFSNKAPENRLVLYFVDGEIERGIDSINEVKVAELSCKNESCVGNLVAETIEEIEELESNFDFNQAFINMSVRRRGRNGKDLCISKFANDPDLIAENDASKRVICSITATEGNDGINGKGYFSPGGYGSDGDSFFHLNVKGLETTTNYKGCSVIGDGRYRRVFSFNPVSNGTTDQSIYGNLRPKETAEFNSKLGDLSYDLYWQVFGSEDPVNGAFSPSLSLINKGVSPSRAESSARDSNKATRAKRRARRRRRKQQGNRTRSLVVTTSALPVAADSSQKENVLAWLNFDPLLGGELLISPTCGDQARGQAVATIVCGDDAEDSDNNCEAMTGLETDVKATACKEIAEGVGELTVRIKGIQTGTYTICIDDSVITPELTVSDTESGSTFGEAKITDSQVLADGDSTYQFTTTSISGMGTVSISRTGSCDGSVGSASL